MVMAAAPSAATGATGLERLLLIFLMKLSESPNAANNTYFSYDRLSDQSEKTVRSFARKLKNTANLQTNLQLHQKPPLSPRITKRAKRTQTPPNKSRVDSRKPHFTDQKPKRTV